MTAIGYRRISINTPFVTGNSSLAFPIDPIDGLIASLGYTCSVPNNTLWYSFLTQVNIDTINIWLTSKVGGGFHSRLGVFTAFDSSTTCSDGLSFIGCAQGPNDANGIDTVSISLYGLLAGHVYYFMIDGYNDGTGEFAIGIKSTGFTTSIPGVSDLNNIIVYPNPANNSFYIQSFITEGASLSIINSIGEEVTNNKYNNLLKEEIDISKITSGIYILKISTRHGIKRVKLLINK